MDRAEHGQFSQPHPRRAGGHGPERPFRLHVLSPTVRVQPVRSPRTLRPGNVHSADGGEAVLKPVIARYADRHLMRFFRGDAAFALPELYNTLEAGSYFYAIRLRANRVLQGRIAPLLKRAPGRPPKGVKRLYSAFEYQAGVMGQTPPCCRQGRVASRRIVPPRRLRRHQPANETRLDHPVLQPARHRRAAHQGRQAGDQLDAPVMHGHGPERGAASASCLGLQSRCLPAGR